MRNLEDIAPEMIGNTQEYTQLLHARMEHAQELDQILHEPIGYPEDLRVAKEEESVGDKERCGERGNPEEKRLTYESHLAQHLDGK